MNTFWAKEAGAAAARSNRPNSKPGNFMQALILASGVGESMMSFTEGREGNEIKWLEFVIADTCVGKVNILGGSDVAT